MPSKMIRVVLSSLIVSVACGVGPSTLDGARHTTNALALDTTTAQRDEPARAQVDALRKAFAEKSNDQLSYAIYDLPFDEALTSDMSSRAASLGLGGDAKAQQNSRGERRLVTATHQFLVNVDSGAEFFADLSRFHKGPGVPVSELLSDERYIALAQEYMESSLAKSAAGTDLYPYKVWRYMNAESVEDESASSISSYEIAIAFNSSVDGVPVIGSGGKFSVHLTTKGEVVAHESTLRKVGERIGTVLGSEMLSPDDARKQADERIVKRGKSLDGYTVTREEFGYLRRGRNSKQAIIAPHYAYFYEPKPGFLGKKMVEVIPATTAPNLLAMISEDAAAERERKSAKLVGAGPTMSKSAPGM